MFVFHYRLPVDVALVIEEIYPWNMVITLPDKKNDSSCQATFYCPSKQVARVQMLELERCLDNGGARRHSPVKAVRKRDWSSIWKKQFKVRRVSKRIVIKPAWEKFAGRINDCVIDLEPGMSFGTGEHETTRACLRLIDGRRKFLDGGSFLDAGCGTGILAIAAAKLGFRPVAAIDNDPLAVKSAKSNFARNGVAGNIMCREADIATFRPARKYSLVAANLFANVLVKSAANLVNLLDLRKGACLVVAGILAEQYLPVRRAFQRRGMREVKTIRGGGWITAVFERKPAEIRRARVNG